jgi:hypothetical protein
MPEPKHARPPLLGGEFLFAVAKKMHQHQLFTLGQNGFHDHSARLTMSPLAWIKDHATIQLRLSRGTGHTYAVKKMIADPEMGPIVVAVQSPPCVKHYVDSVQNTGSVITTREYLAKHLKPHHRGLVIDIASMWSKSALDTAYRVAATRGIPPASVDPFFVWLIG